MTDRNLTHTHTHFDVRQSGAKLRPVEEPAPTMLGEGLAKGVPVWRNGNQANACEREMTEPAPTIHFGERSNKVDWVKRERSGDRSEEGFDPHAMPSQTLTEKTRSWTVERPARTVNADSRISRPGHHDENESGSQQRDAVRVTVQEAAILQSFPADFPWQGSRTAQFRQIGNAVPPKLAKAILSALLETCEEKAA